MKHFSIDEIDARPARHELVAEIQQLQDRVQQLARMVHEPSESLSADAAVLDPDRAHRVRDILRARRARARFFESELFADPAWDMLLELYGSQLRQRRMSVSSLCLGAAVPATTALRWITLLEKKGLVTRSNDPCDRRRVFVGLSAKAADAMNSLFEATPQTEPFI